MRKLSLMLAWLPTALLIAALPALADFQAGLDTVDISGYGAALASFGDLSGQMAQVGADVQINLGGKVAGAGMVVLQNTQLAAVSATDFSFH